MKPTFYPRLAWMGIKKNARLYVPYLLSCAFMAAMLYVIAYLAVTPALYTVNGKVNGSGTSAVAMTMSLGSFVVSVFIALFLFYTNSFLLRRRKKEFGLYSVLGMDRGALSAILFWETLLAAAFTLIAGLGLGLLLSYVSQSALLRLLSLPAAAFTVSLAAIKQCAITFIAIFALLYVRGVLSLRHAQGAALLKSENVGEKPPKSQWLLVIPGLALLLGAYYIAATINDPIQAMLLFFLAVIMVILSTYLLFISGSVTLCKTLQKDEKFYYKKRNFVSLSSLTYRMKRNGAGLASICILATMVLVMLSSTTCLYFGKEDALRTRYPSDLSVELRFVKDEGGMDEANIAIARGMIEDVIKQDGLDVQGQFDIRSAWFSGLLTGNTFTRAQESTLMDYERAVDLTVLPLEDYTRMTGEDLTLEPGEAYLCSPRMAYTQPDIRIGELTYQIKGQLPGFGGFGADHRLEWKNGGMSMEIMQVEGSTAYALLTNIGGEFEPGDRILFDMSHHDQNVDLFEIPVPEQLEQELVIELDGESGPDDRFCWQTATISPISFQLDGIYGSGETSNEAVSITLKDGTSFALSSAENGYEDSPYGTYGSWGSSYAGSWESNEVKNTWLFSQIIDLDELASITVCGVTYPILQ